MNVKAVYVRVYYSYVPIIAPAATRYALYR